MHERSVGCNSYAYRLLGNGSFELLYVLISHMGMTRNLYFSSRCFPLAVSAFGLVGVIAFKLLGMLLSVVEGIRLISAIAAVFSFVNTVDKVLLREFKKFTCLYEVSSFDTSSC